MFQHGAWKLHALSSYGLDTPLVQLYCVWDMSQALKAHMETRPKQVPNSHTMFNNKIVVMQSAGHMAL